MCVSVYFSTLFHCKNNLNAFEDNEIYYKRRFHCITSPSSLVLRQKRIFDFINDLRIDFISFTLFHPQFKQSAFGTLWAFWFLIQNKASIQIFNHKILYICIVRCIAYYYYYCEQMKKEEEPNENLLFIFIASIIPSG